MTLSLLSVLVNSMVRCKKSFSASLDSYPTCQTENRKLHAVRTLFSAGNIGIEVIFSQESRLKMHSIQHVQILNHV